MHQLRDPAGALHAIHGRAWLRPGAVLMTLFVDPGDRQRLLGTVRVWDSPVSAPDEDDVLVRIEHAVRLLCTQRPAPDEPHQVVLVVARHGPVIFRRSDLTWVAALPRLDRRTVAPLVAAGSPELLVVTEHGFRCWTDATGAHHPALRPVGPPSPSTPGTDTPQAWSWTNPARTA